MRAEEVGPISQSNSGPLKLFESIDASKENEKPDLSSQGMTVKTFQKIVNKWNYAANCVGFPNIDYDIQVGLR